VVDARRWNAEDWDPKSPSSKAKFNIFKAIVSHGIKSAESLKGSMPHGHATAGQKADFVGRPLSGGKPSVVQLFVDQNSPASGILRFAQVADLRADDCILMLLQGIEEMTEPGGMHETMGIKKDDHGLSCPLRTGIASTSNAVSVLGDEDHSFGVQAVPEDVAASVCAAIVHNDDFGGYRLG
jgi:hypothetical protein